MRRLFVLTIFVLFHAVCQAQEITASAQTFLNMLNKDQRARAQFSFGADEKFNWHFVPRERKGLPLQAMTNKQREAAFKLLENSLSFQGYTKAVDIINLENILKLVEKRAASDHHRDPLSYYFSIFGTPSNDSLWSWRIEGHHFSVNFTADQGDVVAATPNFWGSNPATIPFGADEGKQILGQEISMGFLLVNSFSNVQLREVMLADSAFQEIITGDSRVADIGVPKGIPFIKMNPMQKKFFSQLLDVYIKNYEFGFSYKLRTRIEKAGYDNLYFSWAGSLKPGKGYYYRIHGPTILIELDNTQNHANHVHAVVRDLTNDFAGDILREHYEREHKK